MEENLANKEIEDFVQDLERTNTIIWNAICEVENLILNNTVFDTYNNICEDELRVEFLIKIAKAYKNIKHNDNAFAKPETCGSYFADFETFTQELQKILDE